MDKQKPTVLDSRIVAKGRVFEIEEQTLKFANGEQRIYERLKDSRSKQGAVMIVPMLDHDTVFLIREYGAGYGDYTIAFPKGLIDGDESLLDAANRELKEEVGYGANKLTILKSMTASPGYLATRMQLVLAEDLYPEKNPGDEPEEIEVITWKLSDLDVLVARNDFNESRSVAALYMVRDIIHGR